MEEEDEMTDNELTHYGIKGMKWGHRKSSYNTDYSSDQRKRDRQIYGKRGERRINLALNNGDSISVARGDEKRKRDSILYTNKQARLGGKGIGTVAGKYALKGAALALTSNTAYSVILNATGKKDIMRGLNFAKQSATLGVKLNDMYKDPMISNMMAAGGASAGNLLGGDIAVKTRNKIHGYDPNARA